MTNDKDLLAFMVRLMHVIGRIHGICYTNYDKLEIFLD